MCPHVRRVDYWSIALPLVCPTIDEGVHPFSPVSDADAQMHLHSVLCDFQRDKCPPSLTLAQHTRPVRQIRRVCRAQELRLRESDQCPIHSCPSSPRSQRWAHAPFPSTLGAVSMAARLSCSVSTPRSASTCSHSSEECWAKGRVHGQIGRVSAAASAPQGQEVIL